MNMPYEMFLTIQLIHLTCRKDRVQSPTRKEGWDLFQRTSNDSSRFTPIRIHEEEPEASQVKDTIAKERGSEEYKDNGKSTLKRWIPPWAQEIIQDEE